MNQAKAMQKKNKGAGVGGRSQNQSTSYASEAPKKSSPTAWMCELGADLFSKKSTTKDYHRERRTHASESAERSFDYKRSSRLNQANTLLTEDTSDEDNYDEDPYDEDSDDNNNKKLPHSPPQIVGGRGYPGHFDQTTGDSSVSDSSIRSGGGPMSHPSGESRIVAPNVSKLSPHSAVEVRLQSADQAVAVLCSVDVLKMRSSMFHDILLEQEKRRKEDDFHQDKTKMWRKAIVIPESHPFEAAALLECVHEGRTIFKDEWNYCWARLSVNWIIEELITEYAAQISSHMVSLQHVINETHWRTSPNVLAGMKIAVFRKSSGAIPSVVTGVAIDTVSQVGYSRCRVAFDSDQQIFSVSGNVLSATSTSSPLEGGGKGFSSANSMVMESKSPQGRDQIVASQSGVPKLTLRPHTIASNGGVTPDVNAGNMSDQILRQTTAGGSVQQIYGDIGEPFWIKPDTLGACWQDPDEFCTEALNKLIKHQDKRIFWEMSRVLVDLAEIRAHVKFGITCAADLTDVLKRPENRILWSSEGTDTLPREVLSDLINTAYVPELKIEGGGGGLGGL